MSEKAKIGLVTYYRYNYGSILQCYATCEVLRKAGYGASVLGVRSNKISMLMSIMRRCLAHPTYTRKFYALWKAQRMSSLGSVSAESFAQMDQFISDHLPVHNTTPGKLVNIGRDPNYCAFLSGSDQIWNGHNFLTPSYHFLRFAPRKKRIAWAPSIGTSDIASYNRRMYRKYISEYASLSVRETEAVEIVQALTGRTPVQLIDPIFLLTKEDWGTLAGENTHGKYALCYFLDLPNVQTVEKIADYCRRENAVPIIFGSMNDIYAPLKGCHAIDGGPEKFVSMIKHADCLFTDSFHGTAFSIVLHTRFLAFYRNYQHGVDQSSRLRSILDMCGMEYAFDPSDTILKNYDFTVSDAAIAEKRSQMLNYLTDAIEKAKYEE